MARGAFWTIIVDDQPTAFRAPVREDLLPTLKQLHRQHPTAVIKWFQRGRLWETPGDAMDASKPPRRRGELAPGRRAQGPARPVQGAARREAGALGVAGRRRTRAVDEGRQTLQRRTANAAATGTGHREREPADVQRAPTGPTGDRPAWKPREIGRRTPRERQARVETEGRRRAERRGPTRVEAERRPADAAIGRRGSPGRIGRRTPNAERRTPRDRPAWKPRGDDRAAPTADGQARVEAEGRSADRRPAGVEAEGRWPIGDRGRGRRGSPRRIGAANAERRTPNADGRPAWKPKGDRRAERPERQARLEAEGRSAHGDRPAWKPKGDRPTTPATKPACRRKPAWKPKAIGRDAARTPRRQARMEAEGRPPSRRPPAGSPKGDRPAWKPKADRPNAEGRPRSSAPRGDWRGDRAGRDATPRAVARQPRLRRRRARGVLANCRRPIARGRRTMTSLVDRATVARP